jgi:hypothetical protein
MTSNPRRLVWALVIVLVFNLGMFGAAMIYIKRAIVSAIDQNNQLMCDTLNQISQGQRTNPPTTESGQTFAQSIQTLRIRYHCKD